MKMQTGLRRTPQQVTPIRNRVDGAACPSNDASASDAKVEVENQAILTEACPPGAPESGVFVEVIRDPKDSQSMRFLQCENGRTTILSEIRQQGQIFIPPAPASRSFHELSLPGGLEPCPEPFELFAEMLTTISRFVKIPSESARIVAAIALASWFPDCFEARALPLDHGSLGQRENKAPQTSVVSESPRTARGRRSGRVYLPTHGHLVPHFAGR